MRRADALRELLRMAVVGDLVIALDGTDITALEQVTDSASAAEIVERWHDQLNIGLDTHIEVWEARPGFYYRKRKTERLRRTAPA